MNTNYKSAALYATFAIILASIAAAVPETTWALLFGFIAIMVCAILNAVEGYTTDTELARAWLEWKEAM